MFSKNYFNKSLYDNFFQYKFYINTSNVHSFHYFYEFIIFFNFKYKIYNFLLTQQNNINQTNCKTCKNY